MDFSTLKNQITNSPAFIIDETVITNSLNIFNMLREQCGVKVLYSLKALPFSNILQLAKPLVDGFSASSLFEARLAREILAGQGCVHLTTPGLRADELAELNQLCSHISFNSLSQQQRYAPLLKHTSSLGLRINPKLSYASDDRFDPCRQHSKLGVSIDELWQLSDLTGLQGLHFHTVFAETDVAPLIKTVEKLRQYFGKNLAKLAWLNLGGGYLFEQITNYQPFITLVKQLKADFDLDVYIEPGNAIVNQAGYLVTTVLDSFISDGKTVVIVDSSVNHLPRVFEFQVTPPLHEHDDTGRYSAIIAGCTCLAGDVFGEYRLQQPLAIGDKIVFKQVGAYSLVKAQRFNGHNLPDIYVYSLGQLRRVKQYDYDDYRQQWWAD